MTEEQWELALDAPFLLRSLGAVVTDRKLRLLGCCYSRLRWSILPPIAQDIVESVERFADGLETAASVGKLRKQAARGDIAFSFCSHLAVRKASVQTTAELLEGAAKFFSYEESWGIRREKYHHERAAQCRILRDIFCNPFRPVALDSSWLTSTVLALANGIYSEKAFDRMPILADALQDAGCDNEDIMNHCRQPGEHWRGCWVVDLLLGKS